MSCEENLPQFSKELVQQNLRKYIQIALLGLGACFEEKLAKCQSGCVFDLCIFLKALFSSLVEWFERFDIQNVYRRAAGCVKTQLNLVLDFVHGL